MNNSRHITIVSHDAGGAEILSNYVAQNKISCRFVLEGPAVNIFKRQLGAIEISNLTEGLCYCDEVLCGTSWQSDLEWNAIAQAQESGKRVVAFLDHWVNYSERFIRNGVQHLPDEIWVGDEDAEELARHNFPAVPICLVRNPYFLNMQRQITELSESTKAVAGEGKTILFVAENISDHARLRHGDERHWGYTEFDAIEYLLKNLDALEDRIQAIVIRPHPSDELGKYDRFARANPGFVRLSGGEPLLQEIVEADIVAGCQSMAMVIGLSAQKKVVSCIPPGGLGCCLPQKQIYRLKDLVVASKISG
jgi:hypothetical protein